MLKVLKTVYRWINGPEKPQEEIQPSVLYFKERRVRSMPVDLERRRTRFVDGQ